MPTLPNPFVAVLLTWDKLLDLFTDPVNNTLYVTHAELTDIYNDLMEGDNVTFWTTFYKFELKSKLKYFNNNKTRVYFTCRKITLTYNSHVLDRKES